MPRFSTKAKEIFDLIWYSSDVTKAKALVEELTDLIDLVFGKIWISFFLGQYDYREDARNVLKEIETISHDLQDSFLLFLMHSILFMHYDGWLQPVISKELAEKHFLLTEQYHHQINTQDQWEKQFSDGWFYYCNAVFEYDIKGNLSEGIPFQRKMKESFKQMPQDGEYLANFWGNTCLGFFLRMAGSFDESNTILISHSRNQLKKKCILILLMLMILNRLILSLNINNQTGISTNNFSNIFTLLIPLSILVLNNRRKN